MENINSDPNPRTFIFNIIRITDNGMDKAAPQSGLYIISKSPTYIENITLAIREILRRRPLS